ncbi:unnamed protein product [Notodromas monacha]|uniref:Uncharacterized protein n=1 Tax=Notodromas monacha TaxID=399045 RepID=A0A7R9BUM1_9CRUS|nr:unnamed protein product [Notodromas monacha]CAG0920964.1 unnamed protein product [Notodromas monacha]
MTLRSKTESNAAVAVSSSTEYATESSKTGVQQRELIMESRSSSLRENPRRRLWALLPRLDTISDALSPISSKPAQSVESHAGLSRFQSVSAADEEIVGDEDQHGGDLETHANPNEFVPKVDDVVPQASARTTTASSSFPHGTCGIDHIPKHDGGRNVAEEPENDEPGWKR